MFFSDDDDIDNYDDDDDDDDDDDHHISRHHQSRKLYQKRRECCETTRTLLQTSTSQPLNNRTENKRKLTSQQAHVNPSIVHQSKRYRNEQYKRSSMTHHPIELGSEAEPILVDPDDYIIEMPDSNSFRAFDWTIESGQTPCTPTIDIVDACQHAMDRSDVMHRSSRNLPKHVHPSQQRQGDIRTSTTLSHSSSVPVHTTIPIRMPAKRGRPTKSMRNVCPPPVRVDSVRSMFFNSRIIVHCNQESLR
jgi:hypothetical protein